MRFIRKNGRIIPIKEHHRDALDNPVVKYGPMVALGAAGAFTGFKAIKHFNKDPVRSLKWSAGSGALGKAKFVFGGLYTARALHNAKRSEKLEAATIEGVKQTVATIAGAAVGSAAMFAFRKKLKL